MGNSLRQNRQNDSNDGDYSNGAMRLNNTFSGNYNTITPSEGSRFRSGLKKSNSLQNLKRKWMQRGGLDFGNNNGEIYALKNDQLVKLSKETQLNFSSIDDYYRLFIKMCHDSANNKKKNSDSDNNYDPNTLDRNGFIKLYCLLMDEPEEKTHAIANLTFDSLQKVSSGRVSFNEFLIKYVKISRGTIKEKAECTYWIYDIDRKGFVNLSDIKRAIKVMMPKMESNSLDEYEKLSIDCMKFLDVKKTGQISKNEFIDGLVENYVMRSVMCPYI